MEGEGSTTKHTLFSYLAIGCISLAMGILLSILISYINHEAAIRKAKKDGGSTSSKALNGSDATSVKDLSPPTPAKLKSVIRQVLQSPSSKTGGNNADGSTVASSSATPSNKTNNSKYQSESVNTVYNLDDFMIRLFKTGFVVKRVKPGEKKVRCLKIDSRVRLCLYKQFEEKEIVVPIGKPYLRMDFMDLQDSFICEEDNKAAFILDFKEKTLLFTCPLALDANYLVEGFKNLIQRLKVDKDYIQYCMERYQEIRPGGGSTTNSKGTFDHHDDDGSIATASTYNTAGTTYSWSSRNGQRNITRIK